MALLETGNRQRIALAADHAQFSTTAGAGTFVAQLSNPFAGATTYAVVDAGGGQLALSGSTIVKGLVAATSGQNYAIKIRATSADGMSEVAETLVFGATGVAFSATVSASVRARIGTGPGAVGPNNVQTQRIRDISNVDVVNPAMEVWNGWVDVSATTGQSNEIAAGQATPYRAAILTGISGTGLNQSAATLTPLTWTAAYSGTAGYIWKLDGTTPSASEIAAAIGAGTLELSDSDRRLRLPGGWRAQSDKATGVSIPARMPYMWVLEDGLAQGQQRPNVGMARRPDLGDAVKVRAGSPVGDVFNKDWSSIGTVDQSASAVHMPVAIWGDAAAGTPMIGVVGDSISLEHNDAPYGSTTITGDADGVPGHIRRALNLEGYASACTAISGDSASKGYASIQAGNGGLAQRELSLRFCSAVISGMGHNDRGLSWAGAAPNGFQQLYRWYWNRLRAAGLGGNARIVQLDLLPKTTSSNSFVDIAGQTSSTGPGSAQYDAINPFIISGGFNTALGDPDAGFSINTVLFAWAATLSPIEIDAQHAKWPANGSTPQNALHFDGTHPKGPAFAAIASALAPELATLLGL